jgi:hypothetical protein
VVEIVGLKLVTHHPVIEPVSDPAPGTEILDAETGRQNPAICQAETDSKTRKGLASYGTIAYSLKVRSGNRSEVPALPNLMQSVCVPTASPNMLVVEDDPEDRTPDKLKPAPH